LGLKGRKKAQITLLIIIYMLTLLVGCNRGSEKKPVSPPKLIGVSVVSEDRDLKAQLKKAMEENDEQDRLKIVWKESKPDKQEEDVKVIEKPYGLF
jgi:uncharacterized lipoprotein NlpE involved in copper resistance